MELSVTRLDSRSLEGLSRFPSDTATGFLGPLADPYAVFECYRPDVDVSRCSKSKKGASH